MKSLVIFLLLTVPILAFGQKNDCTSVIVKKDTFIRLTECLKYKIDTSRKLTFKDIMDDDFENLSKHNYNTQAIYWGKFSITPKIKTNLITLCFGTPDVSQVFIPYKNKYKQFKIGLLNKDRHINIDLVEASSLTIPVDSVDFSKPFYYNQKPISHWGKANLNYNPALILTDNKMVVNGLLYQDSFTPTFTTYCSIFFMTFLLFLVSFFITKDNNFLIYSLYLLFNTMIFAPKLPVFFNFLNTINPNLYFYLTQIAIITTCGVYTYFVCSFLEFKANYPKVFTLTKHTLYGIVIFGVIYISLLIFVPFFTFRFVIINLFQATFTLITLGIFIYLMFRKPNFVAKVVLIGSFLLTAGNVLSIILNHSLYYLFLVLAEVLLLSAVVNYKNRKNTEIYIKSQLALEHEIKEKKSLLDLETLKTNFFTNISHEFRTPLTLISGPLQSWLQKNNLKKEDKSNLEMIHRNSTRLLSLVDQLLDISKIEAGKLPLKVSKNKIIPFISALADSFTFKANQKTINYIINTTPTKIDSYFDADIVEKIVVNILSNAVKYTPEKGTIICDITTNNNVLHFTVKNTGKKLSKEELTTIFERFHQVDKNSQGVGIGLALVKELVTLHKGTITVKNTPEKWTTFTVALPIKKENFEASEIIETTLNNTDTTISTTLSVDITENKNSIIETNGKLNGDTPILLVVDDNADIRTYISTIFKDNYFILVAKDGQEGIKLAIEHIPDIIISDIMMPIKNGIELCNILKIDERTSHIPIIILTAKAGEENEIEGVKTGADDYITKPFNQELLKIRVKKLIENHKKLQLRYSQEVILKPKDITITSVDEQFLIRIQKILDTKLIESSFNIKEFSKAVGMSRMQLHRKLKALTGLSASEFIRSQRLKLAAQLLNKSEINVSQIGYSVGFNDHAYFSKCFKEMYDCSPTEYVKKIQKNN